MGNLNFAPKDRHHARGHGAPAEGGAGRDPPGVAGERGNTNDTTKYVNNDNDNSNSDISHSNNGDNGSNHRIIVIL